MGIPGDGVGPEIMDSTQEVLLQMGAKIDFEEIFFSEVNRNASSSLEDVVALVKKNKVVLRGVMGIPEYGQKRKEKGDRCPQGEHHEAGRRLVSSVLQGRGRPL